MAERRGDRAAKRAKGKAGKTSESGRVRTEQAEERVVALSVLNGPAKTVFREAFRKQLRR